MILDLEKIEDDIHNQIKDYVFSIVDSLIWKPRYYPTSDVLVADITANGSNLSIPILDETVANIYNSLYNIPIKESGYWINKYLSKSYQESHNHVVDGVTLSWNYFLHLPPDSGSFVVGNGADALHIVLGDDMEGSIVFFSPQIKHEVTPNNSGDIRYTIAGNITT